MATSTQMFGSGYGGRSPNRSIGSRGGYSDGGNAQMLPQCNASETRNRLPVVGYNSRGTNGLPSLSRRGADVIRADSRRPNALSPDMLLAHTHGGNFGSGSSNRRPRTASSMWSISSTAEATEGPIGGTQPPASHAGVGRAAGSRFGNRFYNTAPAAPQIEVGAVEEATGVRLSRDQLQALRKRYQGGYNRLGGESRFGETPSSDDLRQEVFGSIVLRPGQWPKLGNSSASESDGASRQVRTPSDTSDRRKAGASLPAQTVSRRGPTGRPHPRLA